MDNSRTYNEQLLAYLSGYVTDHKQQRITEVLALRTRRLTVVLEDIFKPHNASAVLRTAECYGIQDIYVAEDRNPYEVNPYVTRGAGKWLSLHRFRAHNAHNIARCFIDLRDKGYRIVATSPGEGAVNYTDFEPAGDKIALVFGAEETGVSEYVREHADQLIKIPMYGFTESFNISVSAGILIEYFQREMKSSGNWSLSDDEIVELRLEWYQKVVPNVEFHIKHFDKQYHQKNR